MNNDRVNYLQQAYLNDTATSKELLELESLIVILRPNKSTWHHMPQKKKKRFLTELLLSLYEARKDHCGKK